ncbi:MAG: T9SS type A sorting domain-containing protein [Bacteroidales bacterium]|nr:T9SS type A sorting domain-containing protein [Bacteroidales bacterium]
MIYPLTVLLSIILFMPLNTLAQNDIKKDDLGIVKLFPNPVSVNQEMTIEIDVDKDNEITYFIYDFAGRLIKERKVIMSMNFNDKATVKVKLSEQGLYFVRVLISDIYTGQKASIVKKFYIE